MKATAIKPGKTYEVTAGRNKTTVRVTRFNPKTGSWECETESGKTISIKDVKRFLAEVVKRTTASPAAPAGRSAAKKGKNATKTNGPTTERAKGGKPLGTLSGLDAAHKVLSDAARPMRVKEIAEIALANGLCKLKGATPEFTISAAIQREIAGAGDASRFVKAQRGLFAAR